MAKVRTQVYLDQKQATELKLLASSGKKNFSELIREGGDLAIKKNQPRRKKEFGEGFIGVVKGGPRTNVVKDIKDYYKSIGG